MAKEYINNVILGDSRELLKQIESDSVDLLITDPPYKVTSRGSSGTTGGMLTKKINMTGKVFNYNDIKISEWLPEVFRVMKEGSHGYIMSNNKNLLEFLTEINKYFKVYKVLIWDKENCIANMFYMDSHEYIIFFRKGKAKRINNCGSKSILRYPNKKTKINGKNIHDTEKPIALFNELITNSSQEGEIVLDPFLGSGNLALSCIDLKRNYIGFEIDEDYFKLIQNRIMERKTNEQ